MYDNLITLEEIKMLRAGAKTITPEMVMEALAEGKVVPVVPLHLKSGYMVSMTFDKLDSRTAEHVSVSGGGRTDPADAEIIARAVIGDMYIMMGSAFNRNVIHFIKIVEDKCQK